MATGIARFNIVQQADDPARFVLFEAHRSPDAVAAHKAAPHYAPRCDRMESLTAKPR